MSRFSKAPRGPDGRSRELVVRSCPLVAQDGFLLDADLCVRFDVRPDWPRGYPVQDEAAIEAVVVLMLRLVAEENAADDLLAGRALLADAVEKGLSFAPVGAGLDHRVTSVEVRRVTEHDPTRSAAEFRVL